jgi:hypothetical protein
MDKHLFGLPLAWQDELVRRLRLLLDRIDAQR